MVTMKDLTLLQAMATAQAQRENLRVYAKIEISERGKVGTWSLLQAKKRYAGKAKTITAFYPIERGATVPMKRR